MYKLKLYKQVAKYYRKLELKKQKRISNAMDKIKENPFGYQHVKKLKGRLEGKYRYDINGLRIIYYVDTENKVIYVEAMGPRGDVYK